MPALRNHTHCQVAHKSRHTDQNLSKSMAAPTHGETAKIKHGHTTMYIIHKGFSGMRSIVSRSKFSNGGYRRSQQSLTKSYTHS
jgi:hypothetical protein